MGQRNLGRVVGADGITPHIGNNGHWYIGETDTEVSAVGIQGPAGPAGDPGPTNGVAVYWTSSQIIRSPSGYATIYYADMKDRSGVAPTKDTVKLNDLVISSAYGNTPVSSGIESWAGYVISIYDDHVLCEIFSSAGFGGKTYRHSLAFNCNGRGVAYYEITDQSSAEITASNLAARLGRSSGGAICASGFVNRNSVMYIVSHITFGADGTLNAIGVKLDGSVADSLSITDYSETTGVTVTDTLTEV